jgi:hypothetical protein
MAKYASAYVKLLFCIMILILPVAMLSGSINKQQPGAFKNLPIPGPTQERLVPLIDQAEEQKLPTDYLILRVQEGVAKQIPLPKIEAALQQDMVVLETARTLVYTALGVSRGEALLKDSAHWTRIATLLKEGIDDHHMLQLLQLAGESQDKLRYAGGLFLALHQWEVDDQTSMRIVESMIQSPIPSDEYRNTMTLFQEGLSRHIPVSEMAERIIRFAKESHSFAQLQRLTR